MYMGHDSLVQLGGEGSTEAGDPKAKGELVLDLEVHLSTYKWSGSIYNENK